MAIFFNNSNSGKFVLPPTSFTKNRHQFTWIIVMPLSYHYSHFWTVTYFGFHNFFHTVFLHGPHLFYSLAVFVQISLLFAILLNNLNVFVLQVINAEYMNRSSVTTFEPQSSVSSYRKSRKFDREFNLVVDNFFLKSPN